MSQKGRPRLASHVSQRELDCGAYRERQENRESPRALYQDHLVAGDGAISSMDGTIQSLSFSMDCTPCVDVQAAVPTAVSIDRS